MNKIINLSPIFCAANGIVVLSEEGNQTKLGMLHKDDEILITRIQKKYPNSNLSFIPISKEDFNLKLAQLYSYDNTADAEVSHRSEKINTARNSAIDHMADDAPIINLLNSIFLEAMSRKASDIHIESTKDGGFIRFRIDGILINSRSINIDQNAGISARLKLLANLNVLENRRAQDGHLNINSENYSIDVRISVTPSIWGESIVLRMLNHNEVPLELGSLGFSSFHKENIKNILEISTGLVLVCGPTGSGKTTTLAAILNELNRSEIKIISIEDPVEYRINGITQIQVNEELGISFNAALRRIFRQDPDIIMIGEIRDEETAELAIRAALTGHLVFATLHTNNAIEANYRLQNMGIPAYLISAVLRAVIAQRLIRKICPYCHKDGCLSCSNTGYSGRTVIAEIIPITNDIADNISKGIESREFRYLLEKSYYKTLYDDGKEKVENGITSPEELKRELGVFL
jgi:general secretion pathway protein E/type IV pilus assembly protein PilB